MGETKIKAGLFATCLADVFRPQLAAAAAHLIRKAGALPIYPPQQTCCGQIAFNAGDFAAAATLAENAPMYSRIATKSSFRPLPAADYFARTGGRSSAKTTKKCKLSPPNARN